MILVGTLASVGGFVLGAVLFAIGLNLLFGLVNALIIGALARLFLPGKDALPWWKTILVGMAGSLAARLIGWITRAYDANSFKGFLASVVCALVILLYLRIRRKPGARVAP
ncbi:MAG: GlsB/YeaQ/YmgE family stress response membrane protein [Candidatus Eisenbacteria bacterium]